ncbi:MAG TPA: ABC transporter substrate-binding protein [Anaerolineales bacterium]|nr:ABC transporter substrate-binding protein [Anaerolineales bacterium]
MKIAKILSALVAVVFVVTAVGCTPAAPTAAPATAAPATAAPATATAAPVVVPTTAAGYVIPVAKCAPNCKYSDLTVGFIQTGSESGWRAANTSSFKDTAAQQGINLKFYDAQNKLENQVSAFHQFNQDPSVNVIVLAALDVTGYDDVLAEAKQMGKIVVLEDRRIDADPSNYYTYIGSDFLEEGHKSAAAMCDLLKDSPSKNVVEISGAVGASAAIDRAKGFREKMGDCGITITASQTGNWGVPESKQVMESFLKNSKDIQGVFAHNDEEAIGAIQAITEAGLKPGVDIKVIGLDATADGFKYLISGELNADIECNPLLAPQVYEAALKAMNGDTSVPTWVPSQEGEFFAAQGAAALEAILATRKY